MTSASISTIGIGNGLAIVAARSYGAQDEDLLKRTVVGSVVIGLIASLVPYKPTSRHDTTGKSTLRSHLHI